jgi:hypothetical protein
MKCPVCSVDLMMSERQGIEIDYCPQCRGVWLDRGELDKIIERSTSYQQGEDRGKSEHKREYEDKSKHHGHDEYKNKHKKRSFFEEIFD